MTDEPLKRIARRKASATTRKTSVGRTYVYDMLAEHEGKGEAEVDVGLRAHIRFVTSDGVIEAFVRVDGMLEIRTEDRDIHVIPRAANSIGIRMGGR